MSIKEWWIIVDVCDLHCERTHSLEAWLSRINGLHSHRNRLSVIEFPIKHLKRVHIKTLIMNLYRINSRPCS